MKGHEYIGTVTEFDGTFSLNVPARAKALLVSYGCPQIEVPLGDESHIEIDLDAWWKQGQPEYPPLIPNHVITAVSSLEGECGLLPQANLTSPAQGLVRGLRVTARNGKPGTEDFLRIRGEGRLQGRGQAVWRGKGAQPFSAR